MRVALHLTVIILLWTDGTTDELLPPLSYQLFSFCKRKCTYFNFIFRRHVITTIYRFHACVRVLLTKFQLPIAHTHTNEVFLHYSIMFVRLYVVYRCSTRQIIYVLSVLCTCCSVLYFCFFLNFFFISSFAKQGTVPPRRTKAYFIHVVLFGSKRIGKSVQVYLSP